MESRGLQELKTELEEKIDACWNQDYADESKDWNSVLNDEVDGMVPVMNAELAEFLRDNMEIAYHPDVIELAGPDTSIFEMIQYAIFSELRDHGNEYIQERQRREAEEAEEAEEAADAEA